MRTAKTILHAFVAVSMVFSTVATALVAMPSAAHAQSIGYPTSIGFQGRLKDSDGDAIASGTYDFRFRFFDSSDATATSDYIYVNDIAVTNGFFSAPIPLGADIADFVNELELEVGTVLSSGSGASSGGSYETFSSRIVMYKAPYAVFTQGIQNAASDPSNTYAGRIYYNTTNNELKVYDGSAWDTMADTLDKAYDNFGSAAQIITVDDATTGLEFSVEAAGNMTFDLQSTGDFVIQDAGSTWAQFTDAQAFDVDGTGAISLDADAASNFNTSAGDLTLNSEAGSVNVIGAEVATDAINIDATAGGVDIDAATASEFTTAAGDLTFLADTGSVIVKGDEIATDAILLDADSSEGSGIYFDAYDASTNTSGTVTLDARTFDINLTGSSTSHGLDVDVSGAGAPISLTTSDGDIVLTAAGSTGDISISSALSDVSIETSTASKSINIGSTNFARTVNISTGTGNDSVNIANNGTGTKAVTIGNNTSSSSLDLNAGSGGIDIDTSSSGEIQIDGGLTDIGGGVYTVANGDNDLGVDGDLEINGGATVVDLTVESGARIGTGSTPDSLTALGDDTLFVEGAFEVDGTARFDGVITATADVDFDATGGGSADPDFSVDGYALLAGVLDLNGSVDADITAFNIDGGLTDIGGVTAGTVNGDNDLGVAGDFEVDGVTDLDGSVDADVSAFDVLSSGSFSIDASGTASNVSLASDGAGDDLTFAVTGATDSSLVLSSTGTGADALSLTSSAGGTQITSAGTSGDALDIHATGTVAGTALNLETTDGAIEIDANGATNGDILLAATDDFTLQTETNSSVINLFDRAVSKTIDLGAVDTDGTDTINIATEGTSADAIAIGNSHASTTLSLTSGPWNLSAGGVLTLTPTASQTTGLIVTDTDFTNALSVDANNIIGTTGSINFTNFQFTGADGAALLAGGDFDVDASGNITDVSNITSDGDLTITGGDIVGSNGDGFEISATVDSTYVLELNSDSTAVLTTSDSVDANTPLKIASAGTGVLTLDAGGAGALALGSADVTSMTFTTDSNADNDFTFTGGVEFDRTAPADTNGFGAFVNFTAGNLNGAGSNSQAGLNVLVNNTGTAGTTIDVVSGINIDSLASAKAHNELALQIGSGWDSQIYFNDTTTNISVLDTGSITFADQMSNVLMTISDQGTEGNVTVTGGLVADSMTGTAGVDFAISAGAASASNGRALDLSASDANGDTNTGGVVNLDSGDGATHSTTGAGAAAGNVNISGGDGGNASGGGNDNGGNGGSIVLTPGSGGTQTGSGLAGASGDIRITTPGGSLTERLCHDGTSSGDGSPINDKKIGDCANAGQADYAENYPVAEGVDYGDVVVPGTEIVTTYDTSHGYQQITQAVLSYEPYQSPVVGIVSNNYGNSTSAGYNIDEEDNPMPVALVGRVPVKVVSEGGSISTGDFVTTSSTPGHAMRATEEGRVIGMALADWDGVSETVMVQVMNTWFTPPTSEASSLQGGSSTQVVIADTVSAGTSVFSGSVTVAEHLYGSRDMAGRARLNAGDNSVRVTFETAYQHLPIVTFSVRSEEHVPGRLWISDEDMTGFTINHSAGTSTSYDLEFNWIAVGVEEPIISISNGETEEVSITVTSNVAAEAAEAMIAEVTSEEEISAEEEVTVEEVVEETPVEEPVVEEIVEETTEPVTEEVVEELVVEEVVEETLVEEPVVEEIVEETIEPAIEEVVEERVVEEVVEETRDEEPVVEEIVE
jgi:hypothetical protein